MKKLIAILAAAVLLVLGGCSGKTESDDSSLNGDDVVTFTDALNREVRVEKQPERVAALIGSFADVWQLAGGDVCAAAEDAWDDFGLDLEGAVNLGGAHSPSVEALLAANPDFVIASASTASNVDMKETLEKAEITVAYFDVDNFYDYLSMLNICTDITGRKDLYEKNGAILAEQIEAIKRECADSGLTDKERTVLLLRTAASTSVKAKGSEGTILGEMLADLGCINIADSDDALLENLSVESIIRDDPYRIFIVTMGNDTEKAINNVNALMEENPAWGSLSAVKENRMYIMDRKLFNIKPNAKWVEAYEQLGKILLEK